MRYAIRFLSLLAALGLAACGVQMGDNSARTPITGSAGGANAENMNSQMEKCDRTLGTVAVVEDQNAAWYGRMNREYQIQSTVPLIRLLIQQSNCFVVVERGRAFQQMQGERALQQSGELRQGSNFGQGQMVAADYSLNPMITFNARGTQGLGGALGGIPYAGAFGLLAGGIRQNEASTTLTMVDNRSGVQLAAAEGAASNVDFNLFGAGWGGGGGGGLGGFSNTPQGKVLAGSFADAYNQLVRAVRNYRAQEVKGGLGTGGALGVQGGTTPASKAVGKPTK
jgi:curli biogenesis system outer membrane secretion channel CsgG